jgi:ubiquinone/menaquinone biosynthesis C-methylase UbiE
MTKKPTLKRFIPKPIKAILWQIKYFSEDFIDVITGKRDTLTPPKRMIFVGGGDFREIGDIFLHYFKELGELKPDENVLDVGSGIGRMAAPLTKYLSPNSRYEGIDIVKEGIMWCNKKYKNYPNFHFTLTDIYNKHFNPKGKEKAYNYRFPFDDNTFNFVFLTSVFTHMLPIDMENYLKEISRVLSPQGRCLITFFLINQDSLNNITNGKSTFMFKNEYDNYRTDNLDIPETAVAYNEEYIIGLFKKYGFEIYKPVQYGSWCGREKYLSFQDIMVIKKM